MKCPLFPDLLVFSLCLLATASGQEQGDGRSSFYASGSALRDTGSSSGTASMPEASSPPSLLETFPSQPECPCIDSTGTLAHHSDCTILTAADGLEQDGVMVDGVCKPTYQGANVCAAWDMVHDPACSSRKDPRTYCPRRWCYVDPKQCRSSKERYYKSDRFDLYYSYSTCRSIAQEWLEFKTIDATENRTLVVGVPRILWPLHYKEDSAGHVYEPNSPAVFDESIPWRGHLIDYFNSVVKYSNIKSIQYVHRSEGSKYKGLPNSYTQSVSDVEAGIIDLAISTYWVTTERLAMASFTTTVAQDEFRLWIPQPKFSADESFRENVRKILQPFSPGLWLCIVGTIVAFAILSTIVSPKHFRDFDPKATPWDKTKRRFSILTDSLNVSFLEFLGGGVDYRSSANMSQKCLNLGFAFTIFIGVTAYTANLAGLFDIVQYHLVSVQH
ncbi:glutamate receptor [Seminavis robusta]|uniref:Glutamate receptor n=1 Tax=Seminavis robusta TaxID=568900 RepID=A0A9N8F2C6_9STRA|nr:glutamate receptor [Seminavis robusta]|eukprot:Sro2404_g326430.1 glutamate receptor (443) ;mRNA; r:4352-5781